MNGLGLRCSARGGRLVMMVVAVALAELAVGTRIGQADEPGGKTSGSLQQGTSTVREQAFGKTVDGTEEKLFTCRNAQGCEVALTTYGARLVSLTVPDREGKLANVVLGFDRLEPYLTHKSYFGCTTGRFANRIGGASFELDGHHYQLAANNGANSLHGGWVGFDRRHWNAKPVEGPEGIGVEFAYRSPDGEEGYSGTLAVKVVYTWSDKNELTIDYTATTDKPTIVNLTNHAYWNLGGIAGGKPMHGTILGEELTLAASRYLPTDEGSIPTGEIAAVKGTAMDFTAPQVIGKRIDTLKKPPFATKGYDLCYVLDRGDGTLPDGQPAFAARVSDPKTGRVMEVLTTEPAIQFYCGNFLEGDTASGGFQQHDALCVEAQHYPDAPHHANFPSTVLKPGETYRQRTVHRFSAK